MSKKNWLEQKPIHNNEISEYFNTKLPINFNQIQDEFNIKIYGCNFDILKAEKKLEEINKIEKIAGMVYITDDNILLYCNNNYRLFNKKEQRFIKANMIAYLINILGKEKKESIIKDFDLMLKCDEAFDGMNEKKFEECINNKLARQILMPEESFKLRYMMLLQSGCKDGAIVCGLSTIFQVPEREVIIRCKELDIDLEVELDTFIDDKKVENPIIKK